MNVTENQFKSIEKKVTRECTKCNCIKPPRAHHCSICERCVVRMDHHCPWVNNCVGIKNQKHFVLFCFYVFITGVYTILYVGIKGVRCMVNINDHLCDNFRRDLLAIVICVLALILDVLFCLFVSIMFYDQIFLIINNTSSKNLLSNFYYSD